MAVMTSELMAREEAAWEAVLRRDRAADGRFVYAVGSTGVFCRPSCPSRRPRRENVVFFATATDAEGAGYRACRRCRPTGEGTGTERAIRRALEILDGNPDERLTLERLGAAVGMSAHHLQRTFRERVGVSPKEYQDARRTERMKARLRGGDTVSRAGFEAGFGSSRGAQERVAQGLGMTPGAYRRGARGLMIRFAVVDSALGRLLVGATDRGVCAVMFGLDDDALEEELRRDFPAATIARDDEGLADWARAALAIVEGVQPGLAVPLDLLGTAFQLSVWNALRRIPRGETRSYSEIARALGRPGAARAVARACADNHAAVLVPCHRVVPAGSGAERPGGYRWGAKRKRALLASERSAEAVAGS